MVPPNDFAIVERNVYRTSMPSAKHFPFLETLKLKTALLLSTEKPLREATEMISRNAINLVILKDFRRYLAVMTLIASRFIYHESKTQIHSFMLATDPPWPRRVASCHNVEAHARGARQGSTGNNTQCRYAPSHHHLHV